MASFVRVPADLLSDPKCNELTPDAIRLYVSAWAACDDQGHLAKELVDPITDRWGEALDKDERLSLGEILADMQGLGFIRDLRRKGKHFQFKRCGNWLT
jgi:hypothetical protein